MLNLGILGVAWFRVWRALNLLGFLFTFVIATVWGVLSYTPQDRPSTQFFLIAFFLFTSPSPCSTQAGATPHSGHLVRFQPSRLRGLIDPTLIFGVPLVAFGLQGGLVADTEYGRAISVLVLWVFYAALRQLCPVLDSPAYLLLSRSFLALALVFGSLSIPLAFDGEWVATAWAIEGAAVLWIALIQLSRLSVIFALTLQGLAGLLYLPVGLFDRIAPAALVNGVFLGGVLLGLLEVSLKWEQWRFTAAGLLVIAIYALAVMSIGSDHPFADGYGWGWLAIFAVLYGLLRVRESRHAVPAILVATLHTGSWWLLGWLLTAESLWILDQVTGAGEDWPLLGTAAVLTALIWIAMRMPTWPWRGHRSTYLGWGSGLPVVGLLAWSVVAYPVEAGDFDPLPYVPLLNPGDLAQGLVLVTLVAWWKLAQRSVWTAVPRRYGWAVICGVTFVWLTMVLLRTLHHWTGTPYTVSALWASDVAQAATSILWTLIALTAMVLATRRGWRRVWVAAVSILGVVVVKLFVVDMRDSDTLGTIIAFIAVGLLLLIAGYLSPLPPKRVRDESEDPQDSEKPEQMIATAVEPTD